MGYFNRKRVVGPVLRWISVYNLGLEVVFQVVPVLDRQHSILSVLSKEVVEHLEAFLQLEVRPASRTRFCHYQLHLRNQLLLPVLVLTCTES